MIQVDSILKSFGKIRAVDGISFDVKEGENLVLLGASGCGKTTTLRMINRLIEPDGGQININGQDIRSQSPETLRRNIGYVLQHNSLFPHYTVAQNIAIVPKLLYWDKNRIENRTIELLEKLNLSPDLHYNAYPNQLSGGQQQRVNVARALAANPPVLLMDEPFGALDPITRSNIVKDFGDLDELKKKTIVMVTHDVQEAFEMGDRICIMDKGKIMQLGTPSELLFHPANSYVQSFLEKQQLTLAYKAIKLEDISEEWESEVRKSEKENEIQISSNSSIWDAMEKINNEKDMNTIITIRNKNNQVKRASLNEILTAYSHLKNKLNK